MIRQPTPTGFLSTLSLRRATKKSEETESALAPISIHALLTESDDHVAFYQCRKSGFLSTLSLRRATESGEDTNDSGNNFYPRSPYGERHNRGVNLFRFKHFYPRSPYGERRFRLRRTYLDTIISIHALLTESDFTQILTGSTGG